MKERVIKTNLKGKKYQEIIDSMLGQVSDGIWENSPKAEHYWPFISAEMAGKEVVLVVSEELWQSRIHNHRISNAFVDMDDNKVKEWCANKIKAVIKEEGLAWKRDNEEETDYCSRHDGTTVSDCYYVYEVLKGRNVLKHAEYGIREAIEILNQNGYTLIENKRPAPEPIIEYLKNWSEEINIKGLKFDVVKNNFMGVSFIHITRSRNPYLIEFNVPESITSTVYYRVYKKKDLTKTINRGHKSSVPDFTWTIACYFPSSKEVNEDFGCGVADCGADQGIPQGGDCKAVPMMRLGDPAPYGKIQKLKPHHEGAAPFWRRSDMTIGRIKKKKHKKKR